MTLRRLPSLRNPIPQFTCPMCNLELRTTGSAANPVRLLPGTWADSFAHATSTPSTWGRWTSARPAASHPVIVWNDHFNESNDQDWFSGVYASTTKLIPWQESEVYFISRNAGSDSPQFYGPSPDPQGATPRDIYTIGVHFKSLPGKLRGWDYDLEVAGQFGHFKETTAGAPVSVAGRDLEQRA